MSVTFHGFTWDLDEANCAIFHSTQRYKDPAARVAAIILATGQLPVSMAVAEKEFDAELEAWRVSRLQMAGLKVSTEYSPDQIAAMVEHLLPQEALMVMAAVLGQAGVRLEDSEARRAMIRREWIKSYQHNHQTYWAVANGYISHLEGMVVRLIKRDGSMTRGDIRDYLIDGDELNIAIRDLHANGKIACTGHRWHLL